MKLGLTCIPEILKERDKTFAYRTMTRKQFIKLGREEGLKQLSERILHNMRFASKVVEHCFEIGACHYRIPQSFPLLTDPVSDISFDELPDRHDILTAILNIGDTARKHNISIGAHPDQFVILASPREEVRRKSVHELKQCGWFFDKMRLPLSHAAPINIHTSCAIKDGSSLKQIGDRIYDSLIKCGPSVYKRFTLENEDRSSFNCRKLYELHCYIRYIHGLSIPLVLDNLHHQCNPSSHGDAQYWLEKFKSTWPKGITPVMHWSEGGKDGKARSHVDYITEAVGKPIDDSVIWELEVKAKDKAIVKLLQG